MVLQDQNFQSYLICINLHSVDFALIRTKVVCPYLFTPSNAIQNKRFDENSLNAESNLSLKMKSSRSIFSVNFGPYALSFE